jgi:hypothetical protein
MSWLSDAWSWLYRAMTTSPGQDGEWLVRFQKELRWAKLPITVTDGGLDATWVYAFDAAIEEVNQACGMRLFTPGVKKIELEPADAMALRLIWAQSPAEALWPGGELYLQPTEAAVNPQHPMHTIHQYRTDTGEVKAARIDVPPAGMVPKWRSLHAIHELLHVLGRGHSIENGSVMLPRVDEGYLHITERDVAAVRRRYR